jgi:hypothetical protein
MHRCIDSIIICLYKVDTVEIKGHETDFTIGYVEIIIVLHHHTPSAMIWENMKEIREAKSIASKFSPLCNQHTRYRPYPRKGEHRGKRFNI